MPQQNPYKLPVIFRIILKLFINRHYQEEILGDMEEIYLDLSQETSPAKANVLFIKESILLIRPILLKTNTTTQKLNYFTMLTLFIKTTSRQFNRQKLVTLLSVITLIIGALFYQFVNAWIDNEQSMNQFHTNFDRIHLGVARTNPNADLTPISLQRFFNFDYSKFPEVKSVSTLHVYDEDAIKVITSNYEYSGKAIVTDSSFLEIFDFDLLSKSSDDRLTDPSKVLITESFAKKLFGKADPIGKTVEVKCDQFGTYQVGAVIKDIPSSSSIYFDFLVPIHSKSFWRRIPLEVFKTHDNFNTDEFNSKIAFMGRESQRFPESVLSSYPLSQVYFEQPFKSSLFSKYGNYDSLRTMKIVRWLILAITAITFINLQSTIQLTHSKSEGLKKVLGANFYELCLEVLTNRLIYLIMAFALTFLIYQWVFPITSTYFGISIDENISLDLIGISIVIGITILSSFLVSCFKILRLDQADIINEKGSVLKKPKAQRVFTTLQYTITIVLLISSLVIFKQFEFMLNKDTGIKQSDILSVDFFEMMTGFNGSDERNLMEQKHTWVLNELRRNPDINTVSQGNMPIDYVNKTSWKLVGGTQEYSSQNKMNVDPDFKELFEIEIVEGRFFNDSLDSSGDLKVVINEAAKNYYGLESIENVMLVSNTSGRREFKFKIIGVVKDFHYEHMSRKVNPVIMQYRINQDVDFLLSYNSENKQDVISSLEKLYRTVNEKGIFTFLTIESLSEEQYHKEKLLSKVYLSFAIVALVLSSIGLFTFSLYETRRRTKEVGIRKVNGASISHIFSIFTWSFLKTILMAYLIAIPIGWLLMDDWLQSFANRIDLSIWLFFLTAIGILILGTLVITWHTLRIAKLNPIESLRYE